jgi:hypothetical protein
VSSGTLKKGNQTIGVELDFDAADWWSGGNGLLFCGRGVCGKIFYRYMVRKRGYEGGSGDHVRNGLPVIV